MSPDSPMISRLGSFFISGRCVSSRQHLSIGGVSLFGSGRLFTSYSLTKIFVKHASNMDLARQTLYKKEKNGVKF